MKPMNAGISEGDPRFEHRRLSPLWACLRTSKDTAYIHKLYRLSLVCSARVLDMSGEREGVESFRCDDRDTHW
jgi:hypothetical protein